jgi:hypothetical protein
MKKEIWLNQALVNRARATPDVVRRWPGLLKKSTGGCGGCGTSRNADDYEKAASFIANIAAEDRVTFKRALGIPEGQALIMVIRGRRVTI